MNHSGWNLTQIFMFGIVPNISKCRGGEIGDYVALLKST